MPDDAILPLPHGEQAIPGVGLERGGRKRRTGQVQNTKTIALMKKAILLLTLSLAAALDAPAQTTPGFPASAPGLPASPANAGLPASSANLGLPGFNNSFF